MKKRWLVLNPGLPEEQIINLEKSFYQIGRSAEAGIRINNPRISGLHASLVLKDEGVGLIDLDSTNGTRVSGRKVKTADLKDNDELQFAEIKALFREEEVRSGFSADLYKTALLFTPGEEPSAAYVRKILQKLLDAHTAEDEEIRSLKSEWDVLEKNVKRLDSLYKMLEVTLAIDEREKLITAMLAEITRILELEVCGLFLRPENLFFILENGVLVKEPKAGQISESILEKVMQGGEPVFMENIGSDSQIVGFKSLMNLKIQSLLCLPVIDSRKTTIGALYCVSRQSGHLGLLEKDRLFLKAASSIISLSLEHQDLLFREKEYAHTDEKQKQEERFLPLINRLKQKNESMSLRYEAPADVQIFGFDHPDNRDLLEFSIKSARTDLPVLINGETGVGKSMLAREIHRQGRAAAPFITVDCTTLPADLLESELFGHEKGAFTGAVYKKIGKVTAAKDGSLFIDEIGDLPLVLQGKLLRLIQGGEFEPVGSVETQRCKARIIFATNKDLKKEVREKRFREDLFFRLNVLNITLPPLRERRGLILPLADHFLRMYRARINSSVQGFSKQAQESLKAHNWPGNIRELENAVARSLLNAESGSIESVHLELSEYTITEALSDTSVNLFEVTGDETFDLKLARERVDRAYIKKALALTDGNVSQAAKKLNISRNSLMDLVSKYQV